MDTFWKDEGTFADIFYHALRLRPARGWMGDTTARSEDHKTTRRRQSQGQVRRHSRCHTAQVHGYGYASRSTHAQHLLAEPESADAAGVGLGNIQGLLLQETLELAHGVGILATGNEHYPRQPLALPTT